MKRFYAMISATLVVLSLASAAQAQVVSLLVGNQSNFNGIDRYAITNGSYQGVFAGPGNGPPSYSFLTYGPDNNLYVSSNIGTNPVLKFNGMTGNFMSTFVNAAGASFAFGTAGDFFRIDGTNSNVLRYNGANGQLIGTFATGLAGALAIHFGPTGDLFVNSLNSIRRFDGTTGAPLGDFVTPGSGGLTAVLDFLFTPDGKLLVAGGSGGPNDKILHYDGTTGAFVGVFAQGNGLDLPRGITLGPDGNIYVIANSTAIAEFSNDGTFLGNFVANTAHASAYGIAFTPFPVPEPSSFTFVGVVVLMASIKSYKRMKNRFAMRPTTSGAVFHSECRILGDVE